MLVAGDHAVRVVEDVLRPRETRIRGRSASAGLRPSASCRGADPAGRSTSQRTPPIGTGSELRVGASVTRPSGRLQRQRAVLTGVLAQHARRDQAPATAPQRGGNPPRRRPRATAASRRSVRTRLALATSHPRTACEGRSRHRRARAAWSRSSLASSSAPGTDEASLSIDRSTPRRPGSP